MLPPVAAHACLKFMLSKLVFSPDHVVNEITR
jgi:hypothetical protein